MKLEDFKNKYICIGFYRCSATFWAILRPSNSYYVSIHKTLEEAVEKAKTYWDDMYGIAYYVDNDLNVYRYWDDKSKLKLLYKAYKECLIEKHGSTFEFWSYYGAPIGETYTHFIKPKKDFVINNFIFKKDNLYPYRRYAGFVYEMGESKNSFLLSACKENAVTTMTYTTKQGIPRTFNNFIRNRDILHPSLHVNSKQISCVFINL